MCDQISKFYNFTMENDAFDSVLAGIILDMLHILKEHGTYEVYDDLVNDNSIEAAQWIAGNVDVVFRYSTLTEGKIPFLRLVMVSPEEADRNHPSDHADDLKDWQDEEPFTEEELSEIDKAIDLAEAKKAIF